MSVTGATARVLTDDYADGAEGVVPERTDGRELVPMIRDQRLDVGRGQIRDPRRPRPRRRPAGTAAVARDRHLPEENRCSLGHLISSRGYG